MKTVKFMSHKGFMAMSHEINYNTPYCILNWTNTRVIFT